jgi:hypothetical protein
MIKPKTQKTIKGKIIKYPKHNYFMHLGIAYEQLIQSVSNVQNIIYFQILTILLFQEYSKLYIDTKYLSYKKFSQKCFYEF